MKSFGDWLAEIGLESYATIFSENKIDFDVVRSLSYVNSALRLATAGVFCMPSASWTDKKPRSLPRRRRPHRRSRR